MHLQYKAVIVLLYFHAILICVCTYCMCLCHQGAAAYPENEDQQQRLREAAEGLRVATNAAAQNAIKKKLVNRLEVSQQGQLQSNLDFKNGSHKDT